MKRFHIEFWQNGLRLIRSQPIYGEEADIRILEAASSLAIERIERNNHET